MENAYPTSEYWNSPIIQNVGKQVAISFTPSSNGFSFPLSWCPTTDVTGSFFLHMGHAFFAYLNGTAMIRPWANERQPNFYGKPGSDHGGIATQCWFERQWRLRMLPVMILVVKKFLEKWGMERPVLAERNFQIRMPRFLGTPCCMDIKKRFHNGPRHVRCRSSEWFFSFVFMMKAKLLSWPGVS